MIKGLAQVCILRVLVIEHLISFNSKSALIVQEEEGQVCDGDDHLF